MSTHTTSIWNPAIVQRAIWRLVPEAPSAHHGAQPGDVRGRGRQRADHAPPPLRPRHRRRQHRVRAADHPVAVDHRAVRQFRGGDGRRARQGPGRHACGGRRPKPSRTGNAPTGPSRSCRRRRSARAMSSRSTAGEVIPADGDIIEGVASVDESAITGESAPVIRESGGDRSAVTGGTKVLSDWIRVRISANPGRNVPRSDDRAGRRRGAAEDAERDRAEHPAGRADDRLPDRRRHAPAVCDLLRATAVGVRPGVAAGVPHPDHDRRTAVGDRHRRHGPPGAAQRAGDVGPRRRSGRRRPHAAARQDRHDHARQPPGERVHRAAGSQRRRAGRRGADGVAAGRDARGPIDRRAGQGEVRPARPRTVAAARDVRAVHRPDADVRRGSGRPARRASSWRAAARPPWRRRRARDPQGRRRVGGEVGGLARRHRAP